MGFCTAEFYIPNAFLVTRSQADLFFLIGWLTIITTG